MSDLPEGTKPIRSITLKDGTVIQIREWIDTELRATFDLVASGGHTSWRPFDMTRSMKMVESGRVVTLADSSLVMPARQGLPREWAALMYGWRCTTHAPRIIQESDELAAWLASTSARRRSSGSNSVLTIERLTRPSGVRKIKAGGCAYWLPCSDQ